jgi:hypothetical protein|tara:strand:+ start:250 stop:486 length:237 start_codon:yes stop_codon:yes gene_type:complete
MKNKQLFKIIAKIEATVNYTQWVKDSSNALFSDSEKTEFILKKMRQLNKIKAETNKATEKLGSMVREISPAKKLETTK